MILVIQVFWAPPPPIFLYIINHCSNSKAKTRGLDTKVDIGVKYADKQERSFNDEKLKAGNCVIGLQVRHAFLWFI